MPAARPPKRVRDLIAPLTRPAPGSRRNWIARPMARAQHLLARKCKTRAHHATAARFQNPPNALMQPDPLILLLVGVASTLDRPKETKGVSAFS